MAVSHPQVGRELVVRSVALQLFGRPLAESCAACGATEGDTLAEEIGQVRGRIERSSLNLSEQMDPVFDMSTIMPGGGDRNVTLRERRAAGHTVQCQLSVTICLVRMG